MTEASDAMTVQEVVDRFAATRVVPVLRSSAPSSLDRAVETLLGAGLDIVEITLTTPGALAAIARWARVPGVLVGAGTVLATDQVAASLAAGARFVVSPGLDEDVVGEAAKLGAAVLAGAVTPTEVQQALRLGANVVKLFPAGALGPDWARHLRGPFPDLAYVPTGGVGLDDIGSWFRAGALAVGLGGELLGDALEGGSLRDLHDRTRRALDAAAAAAG